MHDYAKIFIGPVSKNVVDAAILVANEYGIKIGLIPSRRQVDFCGGYVCNWTTEQFAHYVKTQSSNIYLERDHGGPKQGASEDDGLESLREDCKHFNILHIDPWKAAKSFEEGRELTYSLISAAEEMNPDILFEVGTEEAICKLSATQLDDLLDFLHKQLSSNAFSKILFAVIQSGTSLKDGGNTGKFSVQRLRDMLLITNKWHKYSKEHNGDWLSFEDVNIRFMNGLSALNIAPEFGSLESEILFEHMSPYHQSEFARLCLESKKWEKWVSKDFDFSNHKALVKCCGHYLFSSENFQNVKQSIQINIDELIIQKLRYEIIKVLIYANSSL